jgi:sugar-specific transcriptional regulator TrmB
MGELNDLLGQLGFSEYEAQAYIHLLQQHPATGYALAKASGIPRANIYAVLQKLEGRGAIVSVETEGSNQYSPVEPNQFIGQLANRYEGILQETQKLLDQISAPVDDHFVQNIQGTTQVLDHARTLINRASGKLMIALWRPESQLLASVTAQADRRGVDISTLCFQACDAECGDCRNKIYRYRSTSNSGAHWLIVISDQAEMVMGTIEPDAVGIRTRHPHLIELMNAHLRNNITLAALLTDMGEALEDHLKPETRAILASLGNGTGWLEHLYHLLES